MTKFDPSILKPAYKLALVGLTDVQMADFFGVAESTWNLWKIKQPEFKKTLQRGKTLADARVAHSLYINATRKGNVMAQMYWLNNRQRLNWAHRQEVTGAGSGPIEVRTDVEAARAIAFALEEAKRAVLKAKQTSKETP